MEYIYLGKVTRSMIDKGSADLLFINHGQDIGVLNDLIKYDNTTYCLVPTNDIIINNDELLKLREKVAELEEELMEIKTTRTLREAYIAGVEKGCESLREDRDTWKRRWNSVVTDIGKSLEANGIKFTLKEVHGNGNWDVVIDIPELNEAKKKVEDLEKKLKAAKSNETFWRDRKEEEENYHHYWLHTFDRAVKQAADKGIHIGVCGSDEENNVGIATVYNMKAEELETRVVALDKANQGFNQQVLNLENDYQKLNQKYGAADNALEYWNNTYNDIVIAGKNVGVKIDIKGKKPDSNAGFVYVTNEKAEDLEKQMVETFADLEKRLAATKSKETYWVHTFNRAVTQAEQKGVYIGVSGNDEENNAGVVIVDNGKANELESQVVQMEDANQKLRQRISEADEEIEKLKAREGNAYWRDMYYSAVEKAKDRGDYWKRSYDDLAEYWDNTRKDLVATGKKVGVKIEFEGDKSDSNTGNFDITNEKTIELVGKLSDMKQRYNKKWQAMLNALKDKGVEVIYMGEQDGRPIIDVKIPEIDILRKDYIVRGQTISDLKREIEELKSKKVAACTVETGFDGAFRFIFTYMDGHNEPAHIDSSEDIDAAYISCDTVPKCKTCAHYMHNPSRFTHDWCYMPMPKEGGSGYIRKLSKEEAEGPACPHFEKEE